MSVLKLEKNPCRVVNFDVKLAYRTLKYVRQSSGARIEKKLMGVMFEGKNLLRDIYT
jgi:hypothetical protein